MDKFKKLTILILTFVSLIASSSQVSNAVEASTGPKPPCRIQIGQAHISSWIRANYGYPAVKVNAFSRCNVPQSKVTLTVEIWKNGTFGKTLVARSVVRSPGVVNPGRDVENLGTWRRCTSVKQTSYFGIAYAKAFIQGKWQFASDAYSLNIKPLACGT